MQDEGPGDLTGPQHPHRRFQLTKMSLAFEGGLALLALVLGYFLSTPPLATVTAGETSIWLAVGWGVAATAPMLLMLLILETISWSPVVRLRTVVARQVAPMFMPLSLLELALISIAAGVGEEMLFRGVLQMTPALWLTGVWGTATGLVVASILFGMCHYVTRTYAILAGLMGVYFGLLLLLTGNILTPIIAHALYDFLALCYLTRERWRRQAA